MEWLNYHHLLYFWMVAREGSITRASRELRLAQPTISGQIRALEESFGEKLFVKSGRNLALTDVGRSVFRYADEIFRLGKELQDVVHDRPTGMPLRFNVGIADAVPKLIAHRLLLPAMRMQQSVRLVCREDKPDRLLAQLAIHDLDLVISDSPVPPTVNVKAFSHLLGESGLTFFCAARLVPKKGRFPAFLDGMPWLAPADNTSLRRTLVQWFESANIRPLVVCEMEDSALSKVFAQSGEGFVAVPTAIEREVERQSGMRRLGRTSEIKEQFYAISVERRLKHPAVMAVSEAARQNLFAK